MYVQDFDIVFVRDTHPVNFFCQQHTAEEQTGLLFELKNLYDDVVLGKNALRDIRALGLEYLPGERDLESWLPSLIDHLQKAQQGITA